MVSPQFNPMELSSRCFLVTGAGSGIGRATALLLSRLGAAVACIDIDQNALDETGSLLFGEGHVLQVHDLADLKAIGQWLSKLTESFGKLHGFVHAAGIPAPWPLTALSPELWRRVFLINTEVALVLTQIFQKRRIRADECSSIVLISSVMAQLGSSANAAYSMSKSGLEGMARSLAIELAGKSIRVNCIAPGFVRTPMFDRIERNWDAEQKSKVQALHPLGLGNPNDVANAAAFLLADTARWITGTVLVVDGGYSAQ